MGADERLLSLAGELYGGLPADFTPQRTAAEKAAKADGDKDLAAAVKTLKKPSVGAWAVNLLVRRETEQIDQVLTLAESLRAAAEALDGAELRALTKQRRQLTSALTTRARQLALEHGTRLTQAVADQVEGTLNAAMLDAGAADAVRTGMLVTTLSATGVDEQTWASAIAVPEALGTRIAPAEPAPGPALHVVPENKRLLRETAEEALAEAEAEVKAATQGRGQGGEGRRRPAGQAVPAPQRDRRAAAPDRRARGPDRGPRRGHRGRRAGPRGRRRGGRGGRDRPRRRPEGPRQARLIRRHVSRGCQKRADTSVEPTKGDLSAMSGQPGLTSRGTSRPRPWSARRRPSTSPSGRRRRRGHRPARSGGRGSTCPAARRTTTRRRCRARP